MNSPSSTETSTPTVEPISRAERIELLDILRALALFCVFLFNVFVFSGYSFLSPEQTQSFRSYPLDRAALYFRYIFIDVKDLNLFALLFGIGFGIQIRRANERGISPVPRYARRLGFLFLIGLAHAFLLWGGDILVPYALLGFLLIPFRNASRKTLLISATAIYLLPIPLYGIMMLVGMPEPYTVASGLMGDPALYMKWIEGFTSESYLSVIQGTIAFAVFWWTMFVTNLYWPDIFGFFLLGLYMGREQTLERFEQQPALLRPGLVWSCGLLGVAGNVVFAILTEKGVYYPPSNMGLVLTIVQYLSVPLLTFFYVAILILLLRRERWRRLLSPLKAFGSMSLTNYLLKSALCVLIFYHVGLGLFTKVGLAAAMGIAAGIFLLELVLSLWWMRRFQYGPMEWIWRQLTYGKRIPLRLTSSEGH